LIYCRIRVDTQASRPTCMEGASSLAIFTICGDPHERVAQFLWQIYKCISRWGRRRYEKAEACTRGVFQASFKEIIPPSARAGQSPGTSVVSDYLMKTYVPENPQRQQRSRLHTRKSRCRPADASSQVSRRIVRGGLTGRLEADGEITALAH
jgi:hypothetical protein